MSKKCYAYIRVSTVKQKEKSASFDAQRSAIEAYAKRSNITILDWFEEAETAAKRGRPKFNALVSLLRRNTNIGVIIHKIDRSARNLKDWADLGELIDKGIEVHFAHESLDLKSRGGRLAADIQAVVAADFIRHLRQEVRKGIEGRLGQGLFPNMAPIGYLDMGKGQCKAIDPIRAPFVQKAFGLYATGDFNLEQLRDRLYEIGLRTRGGNRIEKSSISLMLNNPFYTGRIYIRRTGESFVGKHEPIISVELFKRVQERLSGRKKNEGLKRKYLYQKMLVCHQCHKILIPELQKNRYIYYRCHTQKCATKCVREELITSQLVAQLSSLDVTVSELARLRALYDLRNKKNKADQGGKLSLLKLELGKLDDRMLRLTDLLLEGSIDKEIHSLKRSSIQDEKLRISEKIAALLDGEDETSTNLEQSLELISVFADKRFLEAGSEIVAIAKKVCSNFLVIQKQLVPIWAFPLSNVIKDESVLCGAPYHPASRTLDLSKIIRLLEDESL